MRRRSPATITGVALALFGAPVAAQQPPEPAGECPLLVDPLPGRQPPRVQIILQPSGNRNAFVGGGARFQCPPQSITVTADSIEYYGDTRLLYLIGNVHYTEPRLTVDSDRLTYWMAEERLRAEGRVDATLPSGTRMTGPQADYFRPLPPVRRTARMIAPGRPTIRLVEQDRSGRPTDPTTVVANTVVMEGDSLVYASGRVEITRPDVVARGDSAAMDSGREWARLMRNPIVEGRGERPFVLSGTVIDLQARQRALERVLAIGKARAVSDSLTITADTLDFRMDSSRLQRAYAWGSSRARAVSPSYDIVADSLDVRMPGQRLREVLAVHLAFAQSMPDTTRVRTSERDWLRGDTIVALFDTAAASDSSRQASVRQLTALGNARSFYQVAAKDSGETRPAVNYVAGRVIAVHFANREVQRVAITEQTAGVYAEPATTSGSTPPAQSSERPPSAAGGRDVEARPSAAPPPAPAAPR